MSPPERGAAPAGNRGGHDNSRETNHRTRETTRAPTPRRVTIWRLRWRRPHWQSSTATRVRYFGHGAYARRLAAALASDGADVELHRTDVPVAWTAPNG
jgi:hypothetical protein